MNDKSLECIRFYDIQVNKMVKGRGGVILFTDRGCRLFLECSRNDGFYLRDEAVTKAVSDAGFENVDTYVRNQDGELFTCEIIPFRELYFIPHVAGQSFIRLSGYMIFYKKAFS